VDGDLSRLGKPKSPILSFFPLVLGAVIEGLGIPGGRFYWPLAIVASLAILIFIFWRGTRLARAADRQYDTRIKHVLGPDYQDTMSATAARVRRRHRSRKAS
jgi:hypothetical protein